MRRAVTQPAGGAWPAEVGPGEDNHRERRLEEDI
jgi:hypothetical protein